MARGAALALLALVAAACGPRGAPPSPASPLARENTAQDRPARIVIGAVLPLTGAEAALGDLAKRGIEVALARTEAGGGIHGLPVTVLYYDSESTDAGALDAARRAVADDVAVILGDLSAARTDVVASVAWASGTPVLSPNVSDETVLDRPRTHTMARRDGLVPVFIGRLVRAQGWLDIAGFSSKSWTLAAAARPHKRAGGRLVAHGMCEPGASYQRAASIFQHLNPDVVIAIQCDPREAVRILAVVRFLGLQVPVVADPWWDDPAVITDPVADGVYLVTYFHRDDPVAANFVTAYRALHDAEPNGLAALAHDAATVVLDAISRTGSVDPDTLENALEDSVDLPLATGVPAWHKKRAPTMAVVAISGGTTVFVGRMTVR